MAKAVGVVLKQKKKKQIEESALSKKIFLRLGKRVYYKRFWLTTRRRAIQIYKIIEWSPKLKKSRLPHTVKSTKNRKVAIKSMDLLKK